TPSCRKPRQVSTRKSPAFSRFWLADTITALGNQMLAVAVAWQTYELTNSALALGLIGLAQFAPVFMFSLVGGHAADRYDRRHIALLSQIVQCAVAIAFTFLSFTSALSAQVIYAGAFLTGTALAFQSPSVRSLLPELVERTA